MPSDPRSATEHRDAPARGLDTSLATGFLTSLNAAGSSVFLLHPGAQPGAREWVGDVDLLVTSDRDVLLREIHAAATSLGFSAVLQVPRIFNTIEIDLLFPGSTSWTAVFVDGRGSVLHLDIVFAPGPSPRPARGAPSFGMPEVDEEIGLTYLILKRLRKGDHDAESWAQIARRAGRAAAPLERYLGDRLARRVADAADRGEAPDPGTGDEARRALRRRRARSPSAVRAVARGARMAARRTYRPAGAFVALGGVDGSGKSAVAEALLEWSPFRQARRLHSRPGVLKPMGWYVGRQPSDGTDPHGSQPWGGTMSTIRLVYYWADFAIGYWARIWPVRVRGGLVVSERWWWDMYVDPRRHRIRPMPRTARFLGRLVPCADAFFVLDAPSNRIHERKHELAAPEIERQRQAWAELSPMIENLRTIDAAAPLPIVTTEVIQAVVDRQSRRIAPHPRLVAFPRAEPRWLIDPDDPESMSAALRLYVPSRRRAVAVARGAGVLAKHTPLGAPIIRRLAGDLAPDAEWAVEWAREAAGRHLKGQRVRMTAYLGSAGPLQKVSAVATDNAGHPLLFAKVASTVHAVEALRNEADALERIGDVARSAVLPSVVAFETGERGALLLLSPVSGTRFGNRAPASDRHLELIAELLTQIRHLDGAAHRDALHERLSRAPESGHSVVLRSALQATEAIWPAVRSAHFAHGDFTPWNCLDCGRALGVVDWEMAGYRIPGWDVLHYVVQIEAITHTGAIPPAAERMLQAPFLARAGAVVTSAADVGLPMKERWEALQLLVLIESAVELLSTQPHLSRRGVAVRTHAVARLLGIAPPEPER